jgi:cytochrome c biogenesis protein CcdA
MRRRGVHRRLTVLSLLMLMFAANAWWLLFGPGPTVSPSPLAGKVLLAALVGGAGVAISLGAVLILAPLVAVVAGSMRRQAGPFGTLRPWAAVVRGGSFLVGFASAFVIVISGTPASLASLVYGANLVIDPAGGAILLLYGMAVAARPAVSPGTAPGRPGWSRWVAPGTACLLGLATALILAHELDPLYDAVFFLTGNAGPRSHAPLTVAVFTVGLSLVALSLSALILSLADRLVMGARILGAFGVAGGFVTAFVGAALLLGQKERLAAGPRSMPGKGSP